MVNYSIVKFNASTITGQADNVADAVARVNRAQADRWSSEDKAFVAVFVGNDTGAYPMVMRGGAWWAPADILDLEN